MATFRLSIADLRTIFLSAVGGSLEFYDFIIYIFFSNELSQLFFPKTSHLNALIETYIIFALGYIVRPIGGIIFSHFGDKYGRKKTFTTTLMMMALPTLLIGCLPTESSIGYLAPVALMTLRLIQGLSVGGEIPGAITFVGEHAPPEHRGLICAIIFFGVDCGLILGSFVALLVMTCFSHEVILAWGWRIPFLIGGIAGLITIPMRKKLKETPIFQLAQTQTKKERFPFIEVLKNYRIPILQGITLTWLDAVITSLLYLYLPTYLTAILHYPKEWINLLNTIALIINGILFMVVAALSDYVGRKIFLSIGALSFLVFGYGLFALMARGNPILVALIMLAIAIMSACISGIYTCTIIELFPTSVRYTGMAISFNIGYALFGGLTPLIATTLIETTGNILSPSFYLIVSAAFCLLSVLSLKNHHRQVLVNG